MPPRKAAEWQESGKTIPDVHYDSVNISEVAEDLKAKFPGEFDVVLPEGPGVVSGDPVEWNRQINLRLKNVKAGEIFNAMNLAFESGKTPLHWELTMNGHRPTALLRILPSEPEHLPVMDPATGLPIPSQKPMVFFVGDLVGGTNSGRMSMEELAKTISEICKFGLQGDHVSCYDPAQLLIVRGTQDEISFVQSALMALREKALLDAQKAFAREHGQPETSFWPEQWTQHRREAQSGGGTSSPPRTKTDATNAP